MRLSTARHGGRAAVTTIAAAGLVIGALVSGANSASAAPGDPGTRPRQRRPARGRGHGQGRQVQPRSAQPAQPEAARRRPGGQAGQGHRAHRDRQGPDRHGRRSGQGSRRQRLHQVDAVGYVRALCHVGRDQGGRSSPVSPRSTSTRPSRSTTRGRTPRQQGQGARRPPPYPAPRRDHPGDQPLHADRRDRRGRLQEGPPEVGRPRRHHRHPRLRRRPRPPGAAEDHHRRAQDRRLGHRHRPDRRTATRTWRAMVTAVAGPTFTVRRRRPGPRPPARYQSASSPRPSPPRRRRRRATSTATATPPTGCGVLYDPATSTIRVDPNNNQRLHRRHR